MAATTYLTPGMAMGSTAFAGHLELSIFFLPNRA
jgi:hypothetical protein